MSYLSKSFTASNIRYIRRIKKKQQDLACNIQGMVRIKEDDVHDQFNISHNEGLGDCTGQLNKVLKIVKCRR